jgi:hypothetical protein
MDDNSHSKKFYANMMMVTNTSCMKDMLNDLEYKGKELNIKTDVLKKVICACLHELIHADLYMSKKTKRIIPVGCGCHNKYIKSKSAKQCSSGSNKQTSDAVGDLGYNPDANFLDFCENLTIEFNIREEKDRLKGEQLKWKLLEQDRIQKERIEQERLEKERIEQERIEQERIGQERLRKERLKKERLRKDRFEQKSERRENISPIEFDRLRMMKRLEQKAAAQQ